MDIFTQTGAAGFVNQTLSSAFNPQTSVYGADLYTGTDPSSLNFFERAWMQWYIYWGNPVIATGIMSFLLHEVRRRWKRDWWREDGLDYSHFRLSDRLLWPSDPLYHR